MLRRYLQTGRTDIQPVHIDPCPDLVVERAPDGTGVGSWVPEFKHRLIAEYLTATRHAWKRWQHRVFIDPFAGPGRIQVKGESFTRDGGGLVAWRTLAEHAPFTSMLVGDIAPERAEACRRRLRAVGAPVQAFVGPALETVPQMVAAVPKGALCFVYLDPYNLELLDFELIRALSVLKVDLAINFSTMDLLRNVEAEFDPERARFDGTAPGWRSDAEIQTLNRSNVPVAFFHYWRRLVEGLNFTHSREMPLVPNDRGHAIYRMVFFARNDMPLRVWSDIARGPNRAFDF